MPNHSVRVIDHLYMIAGTRHQSHTLIINDEYAAGNTHASFPVRNLLLFMVRRVGLHDGETGLVYGVGQVVDL